MNKLPIGILGAGAMGTALAQQWALKGHSILIWDIRENVVQEINSRHTNKTSFPDVELDKLISATSDLNTLFKHASIFVVAIPSQFIASVLKQIKSLIKKNVILINIAKGLDPTTTERMEMTYKAVLKDCKFTYATLSGPSMAHEVVKLKPSAVTLGCSSKNIVAELAKTLTTKSFIVEPSSDIIGVEMGGILKNSYAIVAGICDGLNLGMNAKSWLMTRALNEMRFWFKAFGAKESTLGSLSGLGDFLVTAFTPEGRNRSLGECIAKQGNCEFMNKPDYLQTVEGFWATKALERHRRRLKLRLPLFSAIYSILYQNKNPRSSIEKYLTESI